MSTATQSPVSDDADTIGPVDFLVLEFPGGRVTGQAVPPLLELVDRGVVRIFDIAALMKEADGTVRRLRMDDLGEAQKALSVFEGASSGLLSQEDIDEVAEMLKPGDGAGIIVYENVWARPLTAAFRRAGVRMLSTGRIPMQTVLETLDETEAAG
jgi:hypothetical protein